MQVTILRLQSANGNSSKLFSTKYFLDNIWSNLALVRSEGNVNLPQGFNETSSDVLADIIEDFLRAS